MAQEKNKKSDNAAEASSKPLSSAKKTPKSLKPEPKIVKKSQTKNILKPKNPEGTPQIQGKKNKNKKKSVPAGNREHSNNEKEHARKLNSREGNSRKNILPNERQIEKSQKNKEKLGGLGKSQQIQRNKERRGGFEKSQQNQKNKEKHGGLEESQRNQKTNERLGGLVFMCNAKTKPECFRYRVMGVPMSKKDLVLGIKPGLKLFLYDFDLRLMYGIYKAASSGAMKLEPTAFDGAFPVQVRFNIHTDCYPLPENVFKKAIKENYNEKNKFDTELSVQQVKKLMALFRPAQVHSSALPIRSPPLATIRDREVYEGARESWPLSHREPFARDPHTNGDARSYPVLSREKDQHIAYGEVASVGREQFPQDSFLSEKEYRTYGLRGERRNWTPPRHIAPPLEPYQRDHERERPLRPQAPVYRDTAPTQRESAHHEPLFLNEKDYRTYGLGARRELPSQIPPATASAVSALDSYPKDPYYASHYGASSMDPYRPPPRREEVSSGSYSLSGRREAYPTETDHLRRRETDEVGRLYPTYAGRRDAYLTETDHLRRRETDEAGRLYPTYAGRREAYLTETDHLRRRETDQVGRLYSTYASDVARPEPELAPVSSRYSFAGPSLSYR